jgi:multicomponent Na+:H+ antiporter subunit D
MNSFIHPTLFFFIAAALLPFVKGTGRKAILLGAPLLSFFACLIAPEGNHGILQTLGQQLIFGRVDKLSLIFGYVFSISAFIGLVYSLHVKRVGEHMAALLYAGSSLGVVFAGDLLTLFLFWEIMAFTSVFLVWFRGKESAAVGIRYLLVHIFGGLCLLGGIFLYAGNGGGIAFNALPHTGLGPILILIGFMINAAVPPFHAWLPDAYPEATITGIVFMSAFTTKTAVYVLVRGFPGTEILVFLGVTMALYGVVYAVLENDIRRLLAYHIISQVGYMVAGVGMGTEMALNGAVSHAYAHILYKGLLMMGMSSVLFMTGRKKLTELGGLYKTMPITFTLYMIGGFAISAFPLFSGFVTKSMVVSAAVEGHRPFVSLLLTLASAGTFLHTGLKLPYYVFFGKDPGIVAKDPPPNMILGMAMAAFMCVFIGVWPGFLYKSLPFPVDYHPYTAEHVVGALLMLLFTAVGFFMLLKKLDPEPTISVDTDWVYRVGTPAFMKVVNGPIASYEASVTGVYKKGIIEPGIEFAAFSENLDRKLIDRLVNGAASVLLKWVALCRKFDVRVIDGMVNGVGRGVFGGGWFSNAFENYVVYGFINFLGYMNHVGARIFRRLQTGSVHNYAMIIIVGIFILVNMYLIFRNQLPAALVVWKWGVG